MTRSRVPRPPKRHLIRWNEALDKKLLLCIQVACNLEGVRVPWDRVGGLMHDINTGGPITEGAIVQHLAKLRTRMIEEGLPVPPPLRRGGSTRISTTSTAVSSVARAARAAASNGTYGRLSAAQFATRATTFNVANPSTAVKAKGRAKKPHKSTSDEDIESEFDQFDDKSDGDYGKSSLPLTKAPGKGAGKGIDKRSIIEESSEEEGNNEESSSVGEKRKRKGLKSKIIKNEYNDFDGEPDDEDSDDKTVSAAGEAFVGSNASFLPAESAPNSPSSAVSYKNLVVTLKWGEAYRGQLASYQKAQLKLIEAGVLPQLPSDVDSDEDEGEASCKGIAIPDFNHRADEAGNISYSSNLLGQFNATPAHGLPHLNNNQSDPQSLNLGHNIPLAESSLEFSDIGAQFYQLHGRGHQTSFAAPKHDHFNQGSFGDLTHTSAEMGFPTAGPSFQAGDNFNTSLQGSWTNNLDINSCVGLNIVSFDNTTSTDNAHQGGSLSHGMSCYNSDNPNITLSSSNDGSFVANFPVNALIAHQNDPMFGASGASLETIEEKPSHDLSQLDASLGDEDFKFDADFDLEGLE